ncbi:hypothetical protein DASB73_027550 [Starmerella bacillaris]|uniref:Uncharacterized protein n=1 Tax=Starmerella bacillaris TaxID=1247836 RepID=A0AAV5RL38_STABA|nr:hypothetical protein DASB73_027550 [Starmerella bacillaris]
MSQSLMGRAYPDYVFMHRTSALIMYETSRIAKGEQMLLRIMQQQVSYATAPNPGLDLITCRFE